MINPAKPDFNDLPGRRPPARCFHRAPGSAEPIDVSILTPFSHPAAYFAETIQSIQGQSFQNWEWIIINAGASDPGALASLKQIVASDSRIRIITHDWTDTATARRVGAQVASGRYLCFLNANHPLEPTYLEKSIWFLDSNSNFTLCNSYSVLIGEQNRLWTESLDHLKSYYTSLDGAPTLVVRRSAYEVCGSPNEPAAAGTEDTEFLFAMAKANHWGGTLPEYLQWHPHSGHGLHEELSVSEPHPTALTTLRKKYSASHPRPSAVVRKPLRPFEIINTAPQATNSLERSSTDRRRVLFILPWMVVGGADRVNLDLLEGLTAKGYDITICVTLRADHNWEHQYCRFTSDIFILPNFLRPADYPRFLAYLIQSRKIETVLTTGSTLGYQFLPYLRATSPQVALLDLCHVEEPHWLNGGHPRFGVGYQDVLDLNLVSTQHLTDWMRERGADGSRIRVLYSGVRPPQSTRGPEVRERMRSALNIPRNCPVIVFAGRFCQQKRPAMLAEILKVARDGGLEFNALIVGDGELRGQLEGLLTRYRLTEVVHLLGSVAHERWLDILVSSDILLMPSKYEGISISLLEAMAAGVVPVVASVGGQGEIVGRQEGFLIPHGPNELQEYLSALRQLIAEPTTLQHFSQNCAAFASSKHSWQGMIENCESFFDEAHRLRVDRPRKPISPKFAQELCSLAMEWQRLNETVGWMGDLESAGGDSAITAVSAAMLAARVCQTGLGRRILGNRFVMCFGEKLSKRLPGRGSGKG